MKEIKGYESLYSVTPDGKVWSHDKLVQNKNGFSRKQAGRWLRPDTLKRGVQQFTLVKDGVQVKHKGHRLVADAYLDNPDNLPQVNHKDENPSNNCVSNLEWCDGQYNTEYSCSKHYKFINPEGKLIKLFNLSKFARELGVNRSGLSKLANGMLDEYKGWRAA